MFSGHMSREVPPLEVVEVRATGRRTMPLAGAHRAVAAAVSGGDRAVVVYVPGWWNTPHDEAARALLAALLPHHHAPLVLDTSPAFSRGYLSAAARVSPVAAQLAAFIVHLAKRGVPPAAVHLVGFSLGAHVAGLAGRLVAVRTGSQVARITALDPAKPCFGRAAARRGASLARTDAAFVQAVHSSAGVLGLMEPVGHADVYVNGLGPQPECARAEGLTFDCDHNVSWRVYAESAWRGGAGMPAHRCRSWRELGASACSGRRAILGYHCSNTSRGIYLYKTTEDDLLQ